MRETDRSDPPVRLAVQIGSRIKEQRARITGRWLERIVARVDVPPKSVFPTDDLLDHIPLLIEGIGAYLGDAADVIPADSVVVHHARELGQLRHSQGFSEYEILKEFEILGSILFAFISDVTQAIVPAPSPAEALECATRAFQAVALVQQATTARFLELARSKVTEREARLRTFHRALTHEMRNRIGATLGAGQILKLENLDPSARDDLADVVVRNADSMRLILENLLELSRLDENTRQQRHVPLRSAIMESVRQVRDMAASANVTVHMEGDIPDVEVNAAAVELCVVNLLANGIKYSDAAKRDRWIRIGVEATGDIVSEKTEIVLRVEDNGIGVPAESIPRLFERFYRVNSDSPIQGTGLGLSLVRETMETIGGRAWVERADKGTSFCLAMPARRSSDPAVMRMTAPTPDAG